MTSKRKPNAQRAKLNWLIVVCVCVVDVEGRGGISTDHDLITLAALMVPGLYAVLVPR